MEAQASKVWQCAGVVLVLALTAASALCAPRIAVGQETQQRRADLQQRCDRLQQETTVPAMWLAVAYPDGSSEIVCSGVRKFGTDQQATPDDLIHIGSCTKAFTVHLLAILVEQGHLRWEQTIAEGLPRERDSIHEAFHGATLQQLVQHRANLPANAKNWHAHRRLALLERRSRIVQDNLREPPPEPPADGFRYSNLSYLVAARFAEQAMGMTWEELMRREVFEPLGLSTAGFGPPGERGEVAQPWGHALNKLAPGWIPLQIDNAEALGPAGTVHLSLSDWLRFARLYAQGPASGDDRPSDSVPRGHLSEASMQRIITPASPNGYACGWIVKPDGGIAEHLGHAGSNNFWFATILIDRKTGAVCVAAANGFSETVAQRASQAVEELRQLFR